MSRIENVRVTRPEIVEPAPRQRNYSTVQTLYESCKMKRGRAAKHWNRASGWISAVWKPQRHHPRQYFVKIHDFQRRTVQNRGARLQNHKPIALKHFALTRFLTWLQVSHLINTENIILGSISRTYTQHTSSTLWWKLVIYDENRSYVWNQA